ncbi:hypothetical protein NECAME_07079 [Necator americanus]|uniref:Uncharacterized protein n=1 Tax=Necator americanus TaxID=51031 RepID=W2TSM8_NECAM|nr:hypothetical protein NECAME_07079 [Necator americanus]ETN84052.1 hypothetical protein NECAME_07079 [Necator americanus]
MEADREKMRRNIREKYNIKNKDDENEQVEGRIMGNRKTPEQVAIEHKQADDSILAQLGLTEVVDKAKTTHKKVFKVAWTSKITRTCMDPIVIDRCGHYLRPLPCSSQEP